MSGAEIDKLKESGLSLPAYVMLRPDGVFINLSPPPGQEILQLFADRLFNNGARFEGLDYGRFLALLYGSEPVASISGGKNELKLAGNIVRFPEERLELYKGVKISTKGDRAEYMFEPAVIETVIDEPVYGDPDEKGVRPVIDHLRRTERQPAQLGFDEFIAAMWIKGVRFGIVEGAVREAIAGGKSARLDVAVQREPTESRDAQVAEESDLLRQDNAPLILANGKADLRRARNRFPQVAKNTPLLRKIPRALGEPGYRVTGTVIEPRAPEDIYFEKLAGAGTRIEQSPRGEVLIADMDGFLVIDEDTGRIEINQKIENKGGISAKSTGDISLTVDEFTEHGEVQEGRIVEGKHLTFLSDVYGTVIGQGGDINLGRNLSGGRAQSVGGNIEVKGRAISATMEAWDGTITSEFAEGCLIMGKRVAIGRAVNCEIIAEEIQLGVSEGCAIAGKSIHITSSSERKHRETIISVLLPDLAAYDRQIAEAQHNLEQVRHAIDAKNRELVTTQTDPGFLKYLAIAEKVRAGTIQFTPEQQAGWQKIVNQFAPLMKGTEGLMKKSLMLGDAIARWQQERSACGQGEHCKIDSVTGDTIVRKVNTNLGMGIYRDMPREEITARLHELGDAQVRIFSGTHGNLDWNFVLPGANGKPA